MPFTTASFEVIWPGGNWSSKEVIITITEFECWAQNTGIWEWSWSLEIYMGRFRKIGFFSPKSSNFNRVFHYEPLHFGVTPISNILGPFWYAQYKAIDADTYRYWMLGPTYRDSRRPRIPKAGVEKNQWQWEGKFASHVVFVFFSDFNGSSDWRCSFFYTLRHVFFVWKEAVDCTEDPVWRSQFLVESKGRQTLCQLVQLDLSACRSRIQRAVERRVAQVEMLKQMKGEWLEVFTMAQENVLHVQDSWLLHP